MFSNIKSKIVGLVGVMLIAFLLSGCSLINEKVSVDFGESEKMQEIQARGKLIVGSDVPYGVMEYVNEAGEFDGVDVAIAREIAKAMEVELEFVDYGWDELFEAIENDKIDLAMSSITITPDRAKEMLFSSPYFIGGQAMLVEVNNSEILLPEDMRANNIGVQGGTTGEEEANKYGDESTIFLYDSYEDVDGKAGGITDLVAGEIDVFVVDYVAAADIANKNELVKLVGEPFTQEFYGIATHLDNKELILGVNKVIRILKEDGVLKKIEGKYIK